MEGLFSSALYFVEKPTHDDKAVMNGAPQSFSARESMNKG